MTVNLLFYYRYNIKQRLGKGFTLEEIKVGYNLHNFFFSFIALHSTWYNVDYGFNMERKSFLLIVKLWCQV